jgi:hypothetical protein
MTDRGDIEARTKKTPSDASEFEREQLRFLLSTGDVATTLVTVNPSLAWLPVLHQMKVVSGERQLIAWIERNFADAQAIRDVVANIHFFGPETAGLLEFRLNGQAENLPTLLVKCWRLIIRTMKASKPSQLQNEWFEIAPQVRRGDHSAALLERIAEALRPKLKLSKRLSFFDPATTPPERPSDFMSIDYEVEEGLKAEDVVESWPKNATAESDARLLEQLGVALAAALADAIDAGVESNEGYSTSDSDVPSVAQHEQNSYRSGFHAIVRVIAELWLRLSDKSPQLAISFVRKWRESDFRLMRRLALFASADTAVPAEFAADVLLDLPSGELFLTNTSVEVYRLIRARWKEFPADKQQMIVARLKEGPPRYWFREGAEIDRAIDRTRYDILKQMERDGLDVSLDAKVLLDDIATRWPEWRPRPPEQAGFHVWHESGPRSEGDASKLASVSEDRLVSEAKKVAAAAGFMDGDDWRALCLADPEHALRGLAAAAGKEEWPVELWEQLLWTRKEYSAEDTEVRIAQLLLEWPSASFEKIAATAASWLEQHCNKLADALLWPLWDRIADASLVEIVDLHDG